MLSRKGMAEAMYAMDILAAKLDAGNRLEDWKKETGLEGPSDSARPTDAQIALYEGWLIAKVVGDRARGRGEDMREAFRNLVSTFVFLLCREAFGRVPALDELVCCEEVFA